LTADQARRLDRVRKPFKLTRAQAVRMIIARTLLMFDQGQLELEPALAEAVRAERERGKRTGRDGRTRKTNAA
jgi:hypothetical protein